MTKLSKGTIMEYKIIAKDTGKVPVYFKEGERDSMRRWKIMDLSSHDMHMVRWSFGKDVIPCT